MILTVLTMIILYDLSEFYLNYDMFSMILYNLVYFFLVLLRNDDVSICFYVFSLIFLYFYRYQLWFEEKKTERIFYFKYFERYKAIFILIQR